MWKSAETEPFKYNFDHTAILPLGSKSQGSKYQLLQVLTTILLHISQKFNCRITWSTSLYKEMKKNTTIKTLMPRIFFWLPCIHGTSVADGIHQTSTQPPWHFGICPTTAERVLSQHWRNGYPLSVARWSQPGSHIICCELLPYQVLLTAQRDGNHCPLDWLWCYSWKDTDSCSPNAVPCDFHLFGLLKKHLAGKWFGMGADTKQAATFRL